MRKATIVLTPSFIFALALAALAQQNIQTNKDNKDTLHVTVSGNVDLDYVWRSQEITTFTDSFTGLKNGTGNPQDGHAENTFEGYLAVRFNVDLNDKVAALIEIGTKRVDGGVILNWGNATANPIQLREANVTVGDLLTPGLNLGVGISGWTFDIRGRGNSFAFDPHHSQSFAGASTFVAPLTAATGINLKTTQDNNLTLAARAGFPEELEPVGFWLNWNAGNIPLTIDLVALPAAIEGGPPSADEALYAIDAWYRLESGDLKARIGAILAVVTLPPIDAEIWTLGGGADIKMMNDSLEFWGQFYVQFGHAGYNLATNPGSTATAGGWAADFGAQYRIPNNPIWFGGGFSYRSGDNDTGTDKHVDSFLSYENVNDLMILEDMYLGLDWDTNYWAFKLNGGIALSIPPGKENLRIDGIVGITRTAESVAFAAGSTRALGDEIDGRVTWVLTKQAELHFGLGFLFSSKVLERSMDDAGASTSKSKSRAIEYVLGADLRF
jgi:hypothetical protein